MKKYQFKIHGNEYDVEILNVEGNVAEIEVNGTKYDVELDKKMAQPITPRLVRAKRAETSASRPSEMKTSKPAEKKGAGVIKSPLPGSILEVNVKVGDKVERGQKLLMLEAMKMENVVKADRAGEVKAVNVNAGDAVMEGEVLVEIGE